MTPERYQQVKVIFEHVIELPREERTDYLKTACGADTALWEELQSLLIMHEAEGQPSLDQPLAEFFPELPELPEWKSEEAATALGQRIGPYRVERLIEQGGMGAVYEAWRADDQFRQRAALKLIRRDTASEPIIRRFRQERQILAALAHPHIARLLDGGVTE
jgi:eukaryotic-like serine/threonine-protein kinase